MCFPTVSHNEKRFLVMVSNHFLFSAMKVLVAPKQICAIFFESRKVLLKNFYALEIIMGIGYSSTNDRFLLVNRPGNP